MQVLLFLLWLDITLCHLKCQCKSNTQNLKKKIILNTVVIISQYIQIPSHYVVHLKLIRCYMSVSQFSRSVVSDSATPWIAARQASLSITKSRSLPKLMCIKSVMPSSHLILCCSLLLLPPIPPSIRVFSNESTLRIRWPKYWSFSFSISPSNEHPGLIFRMDWLDLLAVQGTLKSLLQQHSSKSSILRRSAFFSPTLTSIHDHCLD